VTPPQDVLELLLPDADELELVRARKVTTFVRLLANDALAAHAETVQVDLGRARGELEGEDARRLRGALVDLLRAHLAAAAGPESFLWCGRAQLEPGAAWHVLDELRDDGPWLADVPAPGEPACDVARRLLASLARLDEAAGSAGAVGSATETRALELGLWRARFELACGDSRVAERAARRVHTQVETLEQRSAAKAGRSAIVDRQVRSLAHASLATLAECLLARGAVGAARTALRDVVHPDERLRRLDAWARLVSGDFAGARRALVGLSPWTGPLPGALADLREHRPGWLPCLTGRTPGADAARSIEGPYRRIDLGAAVLAVFAFRPGRGASPVVVEVAPGLRDGTSAWLADREGAHAVPSAPEHQLIVRARTLVEHGSGDTPLAGTLGGASTLAVVRVPLFAPVALSADDECPAGAPAGDSAGDSTGAVVGWVQLEFEHHLVPGAATLARLAGRWRTIVLARLADDELSDSHLPYGPLGPEMASGGRAEHGPSAEIFRELVSALGIKTTQRLWWGFELDGDTLQLVARGGGGAGFADRTDLARATNPRPRGLARARIAAGGVVFDEPEPSLSVHPDAASGVVVPLRLPVPERVRRGAVATGFLVVESSRKRDFGEVELERFQRVAETFALAHLCARYSVWSRERFGVDVRFDARGGSFRELSGHLFAAARSHAPTLVCGPTGAGKRVVARFLHFCGERPGEPLVALACAAGTPPLDRLWEQARGGAIVFEHVERLDAERQAELARLLGGASNTGASDDAPGPRVIATTRGTLAEAVRDGRLRDDLARRLERVHVRVSGLAERRVELPGLAAFLARRIAVEERLPEPELGDEALALLWRQPWPGNVRELEALLHKLVLLHPGEPVGVEHLYALAEHHGIELVRRLSSRRPERSTILAALRVTRTTGGRANKTRAALYLGWDPDTLVSRMAEAGITGPDDAPR